MILNSLFTDGAAIFTMPAIVGGGFLLIRFLLTLVGGHDGGHDGDSHGWTDVGSHHEHGHEHTADQAFNFLSLQNICAFAMGFGTVGLACFRGTGLSWNLSLGLGAAGGAAMTLLLVVLTRTVTGLSSSGTIPISEAMGAEGDVYIGVPAAGAGTMGKVRVVLREQMKMLNAVGQNGPIETNRRVRVVQVNGDNSVTVAAIE